MEVRHLHIEMCFNVLNSGSQSENLLSANISPAEGVTTG
jgi:hypothetical protein